MRIQEYFIHLVNGDHIKIGEDYDIPYEKKLVRKFISAKPEDTLTIGDEIMGYFYVPKCNILFIHPVSLSADNYYELKVRKCLLPIIASISSTART